MKIRNKNDFYKKLLRKQRFINYIKMDEEMRKRIEELYDPSTMIVDVATCKKYLEEPSDKCQSCGIIFSAARRKCSKIHEGVDMYDYLGKEIPDYVCETCLPKVILKRKKGEKRGPTCNECNLMFVSNNRLHEHLRDYPEHQV